MRRIALILALLVAACAMWVPAAGAKVRTGPSGLSFYKPPKHLSKGSHGDAVWQRKNTGISALTGGSNQLVLYRSIDANGSRIVVSGMITVPKGKPPKGGWPVMTWAHGTTGIADQCAPSRDSKSNVAHTYMAYIYPLQEAWLGAGYAVLRTDYQGLGTPGVHKYLVGKDEGRSVLDIVRAARQVSPSVGRRIVIAGHSQGGHAALWAGALATRWTPELNVRAIEAYAPASHIEAQAKLLGALTTPSGVSGLASLIFRGVDAGFPKVRAGAVLSDQAAKLYPQTLSRCINQLGASKSFGGLAPAELVRKGAELNPVYDALAQSDPEHLKITRPLFVAQGTADTTVFPNFTDDTVKQLQARGTNLLYTKYPGVNHGGVVTSAQNDGLKFAQDRLK